MGIFYVRHKTDKVFNTRKMMCFKMHCSRVASFPIKDFILTLAKSLQVAHSCFGVKTIKPMLTLAVTSRSRWPSWNLRRFFNRSFQTKNILFTMIFTTISFLRVIRKHDPTDFLGLLFIIIGYENYCWDHAIILLQTRIFSKIFVGIFDSNRTLELYNCVCGRLFFSARL